MRAQRRLQRVNGVSIERVSGEIDFGWGVIRVDNRVAGMSTFQVFPIFFGLLDIGARRPIGAEVGLQLAGRERRSTTEIGRGGNLSDVENRCGSIGIGDFEGFLNRSWAFLGIPVAAGLKYFVAKFVQGPLDVGIVFRKTA